MGLLVDDTNGHDVEAVTYLAEQVCSAWNEYAAGPQGFEIRHGTAEIPDCVKRASSVLAEFFPKPPGPFKRLAALLVFGRLYPFVGFHPQITSVRLHNVWLSRIMALFIPVGVRSLRVDVSTTDGTKDWLQLDRWCGFPSAHYKLEFLAWLEWMDSLGWAGLNQLPTLGPPGRGQVSVENQRLARMILVTALMLESCYYICEGSPATPDELSVRGKCFKCLAKADLSGLTYDVDIFKAWVAAGGDPVSLDRPRTVAK